MAGPYLKQMKREINNVFGKVCLTIEYDAEHGLVYNNWLGYQTLDSIILGANACLEVLERFSCPLLLNDNRLVLGPWDHATDWIANDWAPRAIGAGLTHFAHVVSPESFAALSAEAMQVKISGSFHMRTFGDFADAREWLAAVRQASV